MSVLRTITSGLLVSTLATAGIGGIAGGAIAQSTDIDPLEGLGTDDDGAGLFGDDTDPFDLFHRAVLAPSKSGDEFRQQQQQAISNEAEAFRLRQQEALQQPSEPVAPTVEEPSDTGEGVI